jgi:hypothetical protein
MAERRILLLGGSPSLAAALVAALADTARVTVVTAEDVLPAPEPVLPLELCDQFFIADVPELRVAHTGYGPPRLGKKGKVCRW